ncbi:hypothetical protein PENSPDRAFT_167016 [Peniophora sp. CONT]|nr:hypothetical protein PENSPDRAFT_167016 [Peniophora sp. CONT]
MKIKTIFLYFLPPNVTALNRFCHPTYVLERPRNGGWGNWIPDRNASRRSSNVFAPSRDPGRHWSPSSSQPESSCAASVALDDRASPRPQPSQINHPGPSSAPTSKPDDVPQQKTQGSPPLTVVSTTGCTLIPDPPTPLSDPASISSAIQSLSRTLSLVVPTTTGATVTIPESAAEPMPTDSDIRQRDNELNNLRVEHERNTIVCDLQLKRIRELQQELANEREERLRAEAQVEAERPLIEAERRRLEDVQKECSTPYLVPALLEALLGTAGSGNNIRA